MSFSSPAIVQNDIGFGWICPLLLIADELICEDGKQIKSGLLKWVFKPFLEL